MVSSGSRRALRQRAVNRIGPLTFLRETISELRKSVWPSREEVIRLTIVVLVLAVIMGFYLGGLDRVLAATFGKYVL
jgi:preprotein translocase subunit SecE